MLVTRWQAEANSSRTVSPAASAMTMGSLRDALSSRSSTTSSGSSTTRTIRSRLDHGRLTDDRKVESHHNESSMGRRGLLTPDPTLSTLDGSRSETETPTDSQSMLVVPSSPTLSSRSNGEKCLIYFSKPPRSANIRRGPFSWSDLQQKFSLDEQTVRNSRCCL